jgi:hypothetical protein
MKKCGKKRKVSEPEIETKTDWPKGRAIRRRKMANHSQTKRGAPLKKTLSLFCEMEAEGLRKGVETGSEKRRG